MKRSVSVLLVVALLAVSIAASACGSGEAVQTSSGATYISFVGDLNDAGVTVEDLGEPEAPRFTAKVGKALAVRSEEIRVYEYDSADSMEAEAAKVAADASSIDGKPAEWEATPHLFKDGRILVVYVGDNAETVDLLRSILGDEFAAG